MNHKTLEKYPLIFCGHESVSRIDSILNLIVSQEEGFREKY